MPITILPPLQATSRRVFSSAPAESSDTDASDSSDEDSRGAPAAGAMSIDSGRPAKRRRAGDAAGREIVTPGEVITDDPQWMR